MTSGSRAILMDGEPSKEVLFDKKKVERLRKAQKKAEMANRASFDFEGSEYVTNFAKYLIEYLDNKFADAEEDGLDT